MRGIGVPGHVHGVGRVVREQMLEIHEHQFLVLLLVIASQFEQFKSPLVDVPGVECLDHGGVDTCPEVPDLRHRRPRDEPSLRTGLPRADGLVIRVEQEPEVRFG